MPYQSVFGNSDSSNGAPSGSGYKSVFGDNTTWQNNQLSNPIKPASIQQSQPTNPIQQAGNFFNQLGTTVNNVIEHPSIPKPITDIFSGIGNYVKTNILDNPVIKNIENSPTVKAAGDFLNSQGTGSMKGKASGVFTPEGEYTYSGDTVKDVANILLGGVLPAFGASGGEIPQEFSKSKALISAAVQAGVQIAAGTSPKEVIKNLPFGLAGGVKFDEVLPKIETIKDVTLQKAMDQFPVKISPQEVKSEVVSSNLKNTPLGQELLKTAFQVDNHNNAIEISHDPTSDLKTPAGIPVKIEVIKPESALNAQNIAQEVINRKPEDLVVHEDAPDLQTIAQYKTEIQNGARPPLVVIKEGSQWGVEDGKHKLEAYKQLGIEDIPTIEKKLSPESQKINNLKATVTPSDHILNPIIDDIIKQNESQTSPSTSFQDLANTKTGQESTSQYQTSPDGTLESNSRQSETASLPSQSPTDSNLSRESFNGKPQLESTKSTSNESTLSDTSRNGESLTPSKLGLRVQQTAIEKKLIKDLGNLPGYEAMDMKQQAQMAADLLKSDPQKAYDIALGKEDAPKGLKAESVFKAIENSITTPEQATELAHSPLVTEASSLGQRIKALDVKTSDSPVEAIKQVINAREAKIKSQTGKTISKATTDTIKEIKSSIDKATPSKLDWASFVKGIQC